MQTIPTYNLKTLKTPILALVTASMPFFVSWASIFIIIAALISLFNFYIYETYHSRKIDGLSALCISYLLIEFAGLIYTDNENLRYGLFSLEKHYVFLVVPLIFFDHDVDLKARRTILLSFVFACLIASLICVIANVYLSLSDYNTPFHEWRFSHDRISEPIGLQAVYFALFIGLSFLIVLNYFLRNYRSLGTPKRLLIYAAMIYLLLIMVALGARTLIVMLILSIVVNLLWYAQLTRSWKVLVLAGLMPLLIIALVGLNPVVNTRFTDMLKSSYQNSNYGSYFARLKIWEPGIEAIKENFWFGVGTGDHQTELDKKYIKYNFTEGIQIFNMHNQYLQTLLTFGITGLAILLALILVQLRRSIVQKDLLYLSFLIMYSGGCLTESMLNRNKGVIFFVVLSFVFYKTEKGKNNPSHFFI